MITVDHLEMSRSQRALWLPAEFGVPYKIKLYRRDPPTRPPKTMTRGFNHA